MSHPREESRGWRTSVRQRVSRFVWISLHPELFLPAFSCSRTSPLPSPCDEWLHFTSRFCYCFFFFSWNKLQSVQLFRNKLHLTVKTMRGGAAEDGECKVQMHFTLMQKLSGISDEGVSDCWGEKKGLDTRARGPGEECKQISWWFVTRHDTVRKLWPFKWQASLSACFTASEGQRLW